MATCILCGNTGEFKQLAGHLRDSCQHSVVQCGICGHVQITPLPSYEEDRKFYDENQQAKNIEAPTDINHLRNIQSYDTRRRAKFITDRFPVETRILDIGTGQGFFLAELFQLGYHIKGIEISQEKRTAAQQITTAPILNIDLLQSSPKIGTFDVITMFHLIEHLTDPIRFCRIVRRYLTNQGCLIIEMPNLDDLMLDSCPTYRLFWWQRAHISYFGARTIQHVLREAGYAEVEVLGIQRYGIDNMMNWLVNGKPQLDAPSYETSSPYRWLEQYYKSHLEKTLRCDTLMAIGSKKSKQHKDK